MELITSTDVLAAFCKRAAGFDFMTVDTEFLRETTYWPKLCLLQAATDDEAVLIDPLAPGLLEAPVPRGGHAPVRLRKDADALLERFVLRADRCIPSAEPFCPG